MTDLLYVAVTLAAFVALALVVGALDRADRRSTSAASTRTASTRTRTK